MTAAWSAISPVPVGTPDPELPTGAAREAVAGPDGALLGYLCRWTTAAGEGRTGTLAWAQNGSSDSRAWRWMPLPAQAAREPQPPTPEPPPPPDAPDAPQEPPEARPEPEEPTANDDPPYPFTLLGHDHGTYFYLPHAGKQLTALTAGQHNAANFARLAPESFFARRWESKKGFDCQQATFDLIAMQHKVGIYNADRIRGRGSWWDREKGHAVTHLGDRLIINGAEHELHDHGTRHIYEAGNQIPIAPGLGTKEASKLEDLCGEISWESQLSARLLAGFIPCALICGALRWKPNIWLLGPAQSGKSTVIDKIVNLALGKNSVYALGSTTAASLRALLRADALPVIIDDMDAATSRGRENNQAIFELMRIFSGEGSGAVHKASQSGGAPISYKIHSCYIYSSIRMEAESGADVSRIAVLKLKPRTFAKAQYEELLARIHATLTPEFSEALLGRCVRLIPVIRKNAEIFAQAIAAKTGSRRSGDVNGHLFAGAFSLKSDRVITPEAADEYVGTRAEVMALIHEEKQAATENNDGDKCLAHLLEQVVTDTYDGRMMRASIFELLQRARSGFGDGEHAQMLLKRSGILVRDGFFFVANDHSVLRDLFLKSAWPTGWKDILKTIAGAEAADNMRFGGRTARSTKLPMAIIGEHHELDPEPRQHEFPE